MKKYLPLILPLVTFLYSVFFFLQIPQNAYADQTIQCTCANPNQVGAGKNGFTCGGAYHSFCGHQEQACVRDPGHEIGTQTIGGGRGVPPVTIHEVGVNCQVGTVQVSGTPQNAITCTCSTKTTETIHGVKEPTSIKCTDNTTGTTLTQSCNQNGGLSYCSQQPNLSYSGFANQSVSGIGCEQSCTCAHPGKTGNGNNGWTCADPSNNGSCNNREDYCKNNPDATNGVQCVNSTSCTCNASKTAIDCISKGSGDNGADETFDVDCSSSNKQCATGAGINDPNLSAFNQHISGIACEPLPSLPPNPSPPCAAWSNGSCTSFNSALGMLSTGTTGFVQTLFSALLSISGGIALLLIIRAGYQLMTAQGKPEQLQQGRDQLIAAIVGLIFLIFSFVFLQLIGFDILHLPGFGQ